MHVFSWILAKYLDLNSVLKVSLFIIALIVGGFTIIYRAFLSIQKFITDINVLMSIVVIDKIIIGKYAEAEVVKF